MSNQKKAVVFEEMLLAAMLDSAVNRKLTQLKCTITPEKTGRETHIRIIVVPETMDQEWPQGLGGT